MCSWDVAPTHTAYTLLFFVPKRCQTTWGLSSPSFHSPRHVELKGLSVVWIRWCQQPDPLWRLAGQCHLRGWSQNDRTSQRPMRNWTAEAGTCSANCAEPGAHVTLLLCHRKAFFLLGGWKHRILIFAGLTLSAKRNPSSWNKWRWSNID